MANDTTYNEYHEKAILRALLRMTEIQADYYAKMLDDPIARTIYIVAQMTERKY